MLYAAIQCFDDSENEGASVEKGVFVDQLYEETEMECDIREVAKIERRKFDDCLKELEDYSMMKKSGNVVRLGVDLAELKSEL